MRDISHKTITLRTARAVGVLYCQPATIQLIRDNRLPKGNLFDVARAAGVLGAKSTPQLRIKSVGHSSFDCNAGTKNRFRLS